jgi:arylsulfatase A-like enzyme
MSLTTLDPYTHTHTNKQTHRYLSFTVPHAGGWGTGSNDAEMGAPVPSDLQYANESSWPDVEKDHASVVSYLDSTIGKLFHVLEEMKIDDESTLIFFASDNGAHNEGHHDVAFFNSTGGLRGFKRSLYEGGVRSPTMVRWKGIVPENRVSFYPWAFWDVHATLIELTGGSQDMADGKSILNALKGNERDEDKHTYFYFTWGSTSGKQSGYSVRLGRESYKGVVKQCGPTGKPHSNDTMELYDLDLDPFETSDLSQSHSDVVKRIKSMIAEDPTLSCKCFQC